jgi:3-isopropylmalate/(R)-2-methylmalate dehydratase small subunit
MEAFTRTVGLAAPLPEANIDTDIIFPARFLLITRKAGLGRYAFYEWRYARDGSELSHFVLNREPFRGAQIIVAGDNFGCGSSREQAPWALRDLGVRCIISSSFGEIFYSNCLKNGILPVAVSANQLIRLMRDAEAEYPIAVDLEAQVIRRKNGDIFAFEIEAWRREALLNGRDEIAIVLGDLGGAIDNFENRQGAEQPWLGKGD